MGEDRFFRFFRFDRYTTDPVGVKPREEDVSANAVAEATDVLTFSQHPYFNVLLDWLAHQADLPIQTRPEVIEMVTGIARQNTMKEVRDHLRKTVAQAQATIERYREERHG